MSCLHSTKYYNRFIFTLENSCSELSGETDARSTIIAVQLAGETSHRAHGAVLAPNQNNAIEISQKYKKSVVNKY